MVGRFLCDYANGGVGSFGAGRLMSVAGRMPILAFTFIAHLTAIILVYWSQFNSTIAVYCLATAMFGLGDRYLFCYCLCDVNLP